MKCGEIKELLSEYVDDVLDRETRDLVHDHLSACKDCQEELASLKALVRELGSLEAVEPPKDFLEQIHERLEKPSILSRIRRTLFVPMRVKIPLELASAAAVAVLVFAVFQVQKEQYRVAEAPVTLKQEKTAAEDLAEATSPVRREEITPKGTLDLVEPQVTSREEKAVLGGAGDLAEAPTGLKKKKIAEGHMPDMAGKGERVDAYEAPGAYKTKPAAAAPAKRPEEKVAPMELALVMKKDLPARAPAPGVAMESAPGREREVRRSMSMKQAEPEARLERDEAMHDPVAKVTGLIHRTGGKVLSMKFDKEGLGPESIDAEIPVEKFKLFCKRLKELGDLQAPSETISVTEQEVVLVRIRILTPN